MDIIPVIDLKGGAVVHARGGRRDEYRPIETPLSAGSAPADVVAGLLRLYPFKALYIADLDAIEGQGDNVDAIEAVLETRDVWLDSGLPPNRQAAATMSLLGRGSVVIGAESRPDRELLEELRDSPQVVLSLDFRGDEFQGPSEILEDPALWPQRVIAMTLARVGAAGGPDLDRVAGLIERAGSGRQVYAAGGVRDLGDLKALASLGAAGVLVATALHSGAIGATEIEAVA